MNEVNRPFRSVCCVDACGVPSRPRPPLCTQNERTGSQLAGRIRPEDRSPGGEGFGAGAGEGGAVSGGPPSAPHPPPTLGTENSLEVCFWASLEAFKLRQGSIASLLPAPELPLQRSPIHDPQFCGCFGTPGRLFSRERPGEAPCCAVRSPGASPGLTANSVSVLLPALASGRWNDLVSV